jgi:glycosyltransferase involved in cell wall biosynthesis
MKVVHMTSVHNALDHRIFKKECRSLAQAGFDVTVVGPHIGDSVQEQVRIKSVREPLTRFSRMTRTAWSVYREAEKQAADVYHFHDPELIPLALLLRLKGKRVIYDVHEDYPRDIFYKPYLPQWSRKLIADLAEAVEGLAGRHFSAVVAVTPAIAARFEETNQRTIILFNYPYAEELSCKIPRPWESRRQSLAYIGTITPQRGIAQMIEAVGLLPQSLAPKLEIAGDAMPPEVRNLPGWPRVKFHGILGQSAAYELLSQVRVGVVCEHPIPTFVEAIPVKLFEYMGAGLPVIASNFPYWQQLLAGIGCAIFVNPMNVVEIVNAMEYLLTHPQEAEEMGRRGQAAVASRFNWNTEAQKLVNLYRDLVDQPCVA